MQLEPGASVGWLVRDLTLDDIGARTVILELSNRAVVTVAQCYHVYTAPCVPYYTLLTQLYLWNIMMNKLFYSLSLD